MLAEVNTGICAATNLAQVHKEFGIVAVDSRCADVIGVRLIWRGVGIGGDGIALGW